VDISLAVGTLFGLIPFLIGCTFIGVSGSSGGATSSVNSSSDTHFSLLRMSFNCS
ncbi:DUF2755 family protein, partial [Klebsiella pneumoniae]